MNRMIGAVLAVAAVTVACGAQRPGSTEIPAAKSEVPTAKVVCPATIPSDSQKFPFPDAPSSVLVPAGPDGATACRYQNMAEAHPNALAKSATLTAAQAELLVPVLNSGKVWPPGAAFNCPMDIGGTDLVIFDYSGRGPVEVLIDASGCAGASNGHRNVMGVGGVLEQLTAFVGAGPRP